MTEPPEGGNYLVRVRAQVMTRDESSGGWVPLSGGGLANVSVKKRIIPQQQQSINNISNNNNINNTSVIGASSSLPGTPNQSNSILNEYLIYGKRISDQSVVLSCTIKKDFEYNKVMPTFHHWRTGEKKFGLTFQTAADARAFDKGVRTAVEELLEGLTAQSNLTASNEDKQEGEDDVFMSLTLPNELSEPQEIIETPKGIVLMPNYNAPFKTQQTEQRYSKPPRNPSLIAGHPQLKLPPIPAHPLDSSTDINIDNYPYVKLTTVNHEYLYPVIDDQQYSQKERPLNRTSDGTLQKPDILVTQPTNARNNLSDKCSNNHSNHIRLKCKHCQEFYSEEFNPRGSCEYAPDPVKKGISTISCLSCAQCMLYHCMSDAEGDFTQNPCSCSPEQGCSRRWLGLALLSLIVPCLWIYPPLRAVHWCGTSCRMCGGRHHPME